MQHGVISERAGDDFSECALDIPERVSLGDQPEEGVATVYEAISGFLAQPRADGCSTPKSTTVATYAEVI